MFAVTLVKRYFSSCPCTPACVAAVVNDVRKDVVQVACGQLDAFCGIGLAGVIEAKR